MRIIAKAKPIRIRIKSGEEEHSSLDSLRQNLCVQDLWPLIKDKRLSRWLMQLGEVDLSHAIDALSVSQLDCSTYFKILFLFLKDELYAHCVMDLYALVSYWHDSEMKMSKNYKSLLKFLLSQYKGAKYLFDHYPNEISDSEWWNVFCKFKSDEDPDFLFAQGKLAFDGFTKSDGTKIKGIIFAKGLIEKAADFHNQEAIDFINSNKLNVAQKLTMLTPEAKVKIDSLIIRWKEDGLYFITKKTVYDEEIVWNVKQLLQEFTSFWKTYAMFTREAVKEEVEAKYAELDESDIFYKERKFVLDLARYSYDKGIPCLFVKLAEDSHYPLAQYMLHRPADNRIEGYAFAATMFPNQLRFIVEHLFKY